MRLRSSSPASRSKSFIRGGKPWIFTAITLFVASSCSLAYDLSPDQCGNNSECVRKFGEGFVCSEGICENPFAGGGAAGKGSGGNPTTGGTSDGGDAGSGELGGASNPGTAGAENAGAAGEPDPVPGDPECDSHKKCFDKYGDADPWACIEGVCQPLITDECPEVVPFADSNYNALKSTDAIIVGAFAGGLEFSNDNGPLQNYDLAFSQIAESSSGVPSSKGGRQVVAVVCEANFATQQELLTPVDHLIHDLKVPAILAAFNTADQQYVFEQRAKEAKVFMMVPRESDDTTVNLADDGLMYHTLAGPEGLAVTYQSLIDQAITHLRNQGKLGEAEDARIALITTRNDRFLNDLGGDFESLVKWNDGKSASENSPGAFVHVYTTAGEGVARSEQVDSVLALAPHIVVGATFDEMWDDIMLEIENNWAQDGRETQDKPFYVLSPFNYGRPHEKLLSAHSAVRQRLLGITWPATLGLDSYKAYKTEYQKVHPLPKGVYYDHENYFDAAYYVVYGMVAAGQTITGETIAAGMPRLTSEGALKYNVGGGGKLSEAFGYLAGDFRRKIDLVGANGRPNWNLGGGRETPASVWCVDAIGRYVADVLTYDEETETLKPNEPATTCFPFPAPAP